MAASPGHALGSKHELAIVPPRARRIADAIATGTLAAAVVEWGTSAIVPKAVTRE